MTETNTPSPSPVEVTQALPPEEIEKLRGLLDLAARCEAATGPDRELDWAIAPLHGLRVVDEGHPLGRVCYDENGGGVPLPAYTASLDAAIALVPEGWDFAFNSQTENAYIWPSGAPYLDAINDPRARSGTASTPALALCAAALRARHQHKEPNP